MKSKSKTTELSFVLKPSAIQGIGVFAVHPIKKGTKLRLFVRGEKVRRLKLNEKNRLFVKTYCIPLGERRYTAAADFGRMSIGWYLNHSDSPNAFHKNYTYYAERKIESGEEITIDYETL
jgi:SET domain-containing protein